MTPTDLVFPFFLFVVGVSIALSLRNVRLNSNHRMVLTKVLWRSLILFALGLLLWLIPRFDFSGLRFPGVLQRIAIVYLACSLAVSITKWRTQVRLGLACLVGYWAS